jgi:hypothetical protein
MTIYTLGLVSFLTLSLTVLGLSIRIRLPLALLLPLATLRGSLSLLAYLTPLFSFTTPTTFHFFPEELDVLLHGEFIRELISGRELGGTFELPGFGVFDFGYLADAGLWDKAIDGYVCGYIPEVFFFRVFRESCSAVVEYHVHTFMFKDVAYFGIGEFCEEVRVYFEPDTGAFYTDSHGGAFGGDFFIHEEQDFMDEHIIHYQGGQEPVPSSVRTDIVLGFIGSYDFSRHLCLLIVEEDHFQ